ncbi:hypothetical protein [Microbacterium terrisoli]|uniref:hypothetical protein n=1 Tax=Microbacterium terrisoli TaxID=3242192 RepID=UPI00280554FC|nr:hypothetical protein [Microbacterium protaetiae]
MADDDLSKLVADLSAVAKGSPKKARQVVQQTGIRTKKHWQEISKNPAGSRYSATIDYEITGSVLDGDVELEVGPDLTRYGGKTGHGGLVPSFGIFDDPLSTGSIKRAPDRARRRAEKFAADDVEKGIGIALDQLLKENGL